MDSNEPSRVHEENAVRQVQKLRSNKLAQIGITIGTVLAAWLAVGAPSYWN